ncbi:DNA-binding response regulator [Pedobacter chinensis]|uniref:DNA-binding response regulator n=1 Tax=Pedobacter chinensis TaxID=2282421 RepID=A0A369PXI4_9SPHI|nr:response regulator transcription factor [Pedobacter chinensis]RDC55379.1 DNA-binding response regulator [Pedobacter chinensis]
MNIKTLSCIIVDDEAFSIELLSDRISSFKNLKIVKTFTNPLEALAEIGSATEIDILFIDIDMPDLSGLNLAEKVRHKVKYIIFTTAYPQFALEAFGVKAYDYLLKPIDNLKFIESIGRLITLANDSVSTANKKDDFIFIKGDLKGKYIKLMPEEIVLIYTRSHMVFIETTKGQFKTNDTIRNVESKLLPSDKRFLRVHQSNIINVDKILKIEGNTIYLDYKWEVPIGENYKKIVMEFVKEKLLNPGSANRDSTT